jgi:hypothetical protein
VLSLWTLGYFAQVFEPAVSDDGPGRAVAAADFDNDGALDLYVLRDGAADLLLFGDGAGGFTRSTAALAETGGAGEVAVCADLDGDGGVDVYVARNGEANVLMRNQVAGRGHWLGLDLAGDPANRDAVGALVRVVSDGVSQLREVRAGGGRGEAGLRLHVGLGEAAVADSVIVHWPDGEVTVLTDVTADRTVAVAQTTDPTGVDQGPPPAITRLHGAYPNPFNPTTRIRFELAAAGPVRLTVYSLDGRRVADLVRDDLPAGAHQVTWQGRDRDGRAVASGTYLLRLETRSEALSSRLTLVK